MTNHASNAVQVVRVTALMLEDVREVDHANLDTRMVFQESFRGSVVSDKNRTGIERVPGWRGKPPLDGT